MAYTLTGGTGINFWCLKVGRLASPGHLTYVYFWSSKTSSNTISDSIQDFWYHCDSIHELNQQALRNRVSVGGQASNVVRVVKTTIKDD